MMVNCQDFILPGNVIQQVFIKSATSFLHNKCNTYLINILWHVDPFLGSGPVNTHSWQYAGNNQITSIAVQRTVNTIGEYDEAQQRVREW
jgi:hypothetical protein